MPAQASDAPEVRIEVVQGLFRDVPPVMIKALGRPLKDLINKRTGLTVDVDTATDALSLADRVKEKKCHLGVFHGYEFAWAQAQDPELVPLVVTVPSTGQPQACVVVHVDSKATSLADLKQQAVTVPLQTKGHCYAYLERARADLPETTATVKTQPINAEGALDAVVAGTSPATIVDVSLLAGYHKLQPAAAKNLRILCESERFPQNVIAYRKGTLTPEVAEQLRKVLTEAHTTPAGKPLMALWQITNFDHAPADYTKQLERSVKNYPPPTAPTAGALPVRGLAPQSP